MRLTKTTIRLNGISLYGHHGIGEEEQKVGSHFVIHAALTIPSPASRFKEDTLDESINYAEAYHIIKGAFLKPSGTLENVASRMLDDLFSAFPLLEEAEIEIEKLRPPFPADCHSASVRLSARRE